MSLFAGIDYDSNGIYIVAVDETTGVYAWRHKATLTAAKADSFDRVRRVPSQLPGASHFDDVVAIGIETPFTKQMNSLIALMRVQGAILASLPRQLEVIALTPNRKAENHGWKALTVGKTNASKDEVAFWAKCNGAPIGLAQDFYDAFALAHAARAIHAQREQPIDLTPKAA